MESSLPELSARSSHHPSLAKFVSTRHQAKDLCGPRQAPTSRFSDRQLRHAGTTGGEALDEPHHWIRNIGEVAPEINERRSLDSLVLRPSTVAGVAARHSTSNGELTASLPSRMPRSRKVSSSYASDSQASPSSSIRQSDSSVICDPRMSNQTFGSNKISSTRPGQLPVAHQSSSRASRSSASSTRRSLDEASMRKSSRHILRMSSTGASRGRVAPPNETDRTPRLPPASGIINTSDSRTPLKPIDELARTTKSRLSEMPVTDSAPQNVASTLKPSTRKWNMLRATVKSVGTFQTLAESQGKILLSTGQYIQVDELLRLNAIFASLSPNEDGQASWSAAITRKLKSSSSTLNSLKSKIAVLGQTTFNFQDLLGVHYPGCTPEDISRMLDSIKTKREREEISKLDKGFTSEAADIFESLVKDSEQTPPMEIDYDTLFEGLVNEFPNAMNINNVMKTIDKDILERLYDGGTMTKNEFIIWHSKKINGSVKQVWVPDVTAEIPGKTMKASGQAARNRALTKKRLTPTTVLSGYLSTFYQRQQTADAAARFAIS